MSTTHGQGDSPHHDMVRRAVQGDIEALTELLATHGPHVEAKLKIGRQWRNVLEPSDVMQVTYLEAFMQIGNFRPDQAAAFPAWLRRIAENNLRDAIRGLERQKQPQPSRRVDAAVTADSFVCLYEHLAATSMTPSRIVAKEDAKRLLEAAIAELPDDYAATVRMYDLQGCPIAEVCKALNRSAGAVHMLRARAHDRLCELLGTASNWFGSRA